MRFVYYSLVNSTDADREWQLIQSIRSLRLHNHSIPIWLFLFNAATTELLHEADRWNVHIHFLGNYDEFLQQNHRCGSVLARYPTFHKFLALTKGPLAGLSQVLYLDCDTFFFDDVDLLFDKYSEQEWYAREETMTRRSHFGSDPNHLNEDLLEHIVQCEGLRHVTPFNTGLCLLNHGIWNALEDLAAPFLDLAWRLLCGCELNSHDGRLIHDVEIQRAVLEGLTDLDRSRAIPYPSYNLWLIDELALWLALGHLPSLSLDTFSPDDVAQGGEFRDVMVSPNRPIVAHYYNAGESEFFATVAPIDA